MPVTPQHAFRVASVTKSFTAAAVLRLMETDYWPYIKSKEATQSRG
jgi:Beta-lactamase